MRKLLLFLVTLCGTFASAQTDCSLFWRKDSVQLKEIDSQEAVQYKKVGHHGPAVENMYMALRLYFNDSGAIDIYSKAKPGLELEKYLWYPSNSAIENDLAGCDEYRVGKTVGLGGISLWDGEKEIKLTATKGRKASVNPINGGHQMCMLSRGVIYKGDTIDIEVTVTVKAKDRWVQIDAKAIGGKKVKFLTGVNYHKGQNTSYTKFFCTHTLYAAGIHPADVVEHPLPIYATMKAKKKYWKVFDQTDDMLRLVSKDCDHVVSFVSATCLRELEYLFGEKAKDENQAILLSKKILGL